MNKWPNPGVTVNLGCLDDVTSFDQLLINRNKYVFVRNGVSSLAVNKK